MTKCTAKGGKAKTTAKAVTKKAKPAAKKTKTAGKKK